ncbi:Calcium/calmodulin-dependent protein kinase kinase 2 isoform B [Neolecta irregularis DAH-3]|uniref:Calcium/calmodulin-dependent protein kinase kinase 2 isoform B n=1 Tax=Neolecta irregularis (strain DAH-3) TaxID=1198029 RepID=A0A1U7LP69_NEOID|nr:Calcium/calmodulin-dependent protein kinase kinase 2 isoform B [Neolecta irregularis DAH-3]|eukprot:OLL24444.1 Calcium/calmodulin-dependent protein kinase kinase 2 isoform B [Neolecta irregularis DAH-3]
MYSPRPCRTCRTRPYCHQTATAADIPQRPPLARHMTTPGCSSHPRTRLSPRVVKETLNATLTETLAGARMLNHYLIKEPIGRGSFGAVYLAVDSFSNCEYAIKEFSKARLRRRSQSVILRRARSTAPRPPLPHRRSASDIHHDEERGNPLHLIRGELAVMKKLAHANVVDLIEVLDDPNNDSLYMVLGLCKKGVIMDISLASKATPYTDSQCRKWFRDLILGIEYLHAQEIVHRDIKPDNLLLTKDGTLKIVDFGVSEMFSKNDDTLRDTAGSPAFLAPECLV